MQCNDDLKVGLYPRVLRLCIYPYVNDVKTLTFCNGTEYGKHHSNTSHTFIKESNTCFNNILSLLLYSYCFTEDKRIV